MSVLAWLATMAGFVPLAVALRANRTTSLFFSILWAAAAWTAWGFALADAANRDRAFIALSLTACAGVAVFGARRPHVAAWNAVVAGLLAVMLLPMLERLVISVESFNIERTVFLAAVIAVSVINYLPTRFLAAALLFGAGCSLAMWRLMSAKVLTGFDDELQLALLALTPWLAWISPAGPRDPFDAQWRAFRDRFGLVWASRVRDQFNRAASNAELSVRLTWSGHTGDDVDSAADLLASLTRRFMSR